MVRIYAKYYGKLSRHRNCVAKADASSRIASMNELVNQSSSKQRTRPGTEHNGHGPNSSCRTRCTSGGSHTSITYVLIAQKVVGYR